MSMIEEEETKSPSEFGAGLVVCLVKFSEHLGNDWYMRIMRGIWWMGLTDEKKAEQEAEARKYPYGDAAQRMMDVHSVFFMERSDEEAISSAIMLWLNGASDHFYDLDRERAPEPLLKLADLCLKIGHGFDNKTLWGKEHIQLINDLWQESCLALDKKLGTNPDWGEW